MDSYHGGQKNNNPEDEIILKLLLLVFSELLKGLIDKMLG